MNTGDRKRGHYLGTEIDERWWRRYSKEGFLARGIGEYWIDCTKWLGSRWADGTPVGGLAESQSSNWFGVKEAARLSSGFVLSADRRETERLAAELRSQAK